jgi:hypothetical protein
MLRASPRRLSVGSAISAEVFNREWPDHVGSSRERIVHQASPEFGVANMIAATANGAATNAWPSANKPVAIPFRVFIGMSVYQLGWLNGSGTMTDGFDIGVYDASWNRKVSGGGTTRSGASTVQWVDVTDTFLPVGKYYLVGAGNGTTASQFQNYMSSSGYTAAYNSFLGIQDSATNAYPLPDPLTNMVPCATFTVIPRMMMAARVPF